MVHGTMVLSLTITRGVPAVCRLGQRLRLDALKVVMQVSGWYHDYAIGLICNGMMVYGRLLM
eukprot:CAMPEP_0119108222 /NCGR_PEP_ID=MMETSP1180-20130426/13531_1 /TAXON_ID=3052 ORGANISM="Chlamydomonas cf sp, Strain CCMP681" /NCGR_SAMPLE_ID=MMETSP1180 /ASSEMBLY_ACC=CAM_ASM_000741 /LENGTH=61 /DNA_ID=CAMNT_0007093813 /DNA_START=1497 /DNA_END=1682 /DNA_ORIENTATION=+